ncbi:MAG TPA: putative selenate reductase subunit YgfK [Ignavibacteriaceae bacterium]|nr:putative selenate reductase subunit YgfK [Ignavibacteriaceae bacterium]
MSDKLYTLPIEKLVRIILDGYKEGKIFGYYKELFFNAIDHTKLKMMRYGQILDTPLGVAAGPHTQLSQNIIISWLFGARYIELKTVQTLDELEITKPCIDMQDEGYNCEWSQELKLEKSLDEYINAWITIHLLNDLVFQNPQSPNLIFNVSVGYDLNGIKSEAVKKFLNGMNNASSRIEEKIYKIAKMYPRISEINIPSTISDNVTLSTMHGCPPEEIEKIATHLMEDWKFHTTIKLNPTLLGVDKLRWILNKKLNYDVEVPDSAFDHDLKYDDAKVLIKRLTECSIKNEVEFNLKLTNTLETNNQNTSLPGNEKVVYLSGKALHPISVNLAYKLQNEFDGELDVSFSAGVDAFNFADVVSCNLKPATVCSDLLKPGGYSRLKQYLSSLSTEMEKYSSNTIDEFIKAKGNSSNIKEAALHNLKKYSEEVVESAKYKKNMFFKNSIKTKRKLTPLDCIGAPCVETCAIKQDIPDYLFQTANKNFEEAYKIILNENPLPGITGMVCDHLCESKCTRMNIDNSIAIRDVKRFIAESNSTIPITAIESKDKTKVAIIGAGPSGLSAAYFLAMNGFQVSVYETKSFAGGMASGAIPSFRISEEAIQSDINNIKFLGVRFFFNQKIDKAEFETLQKDYEYIYIAVGAQKGKKLNIEGEDLPGVFDQITFLSKVHEQKERFKGKQIAIIGGGNSAIDAARTAKRLAGLDGSVTIVYRRTKYEMPADRDEIKALEEENIGLIELTAPENIKQIDNRLVLTCKKMKLGEPDSSGRRRPVIIQNSEYDMEYDIIISAIGQHVELDFIAEDELTIDEKSKKTDIKNVFAGGDAIRGADTLINAIADGKKAALSILKNHIAASSLSKQTKIDVKEHQLKLSNRKYGKRITAISPDMRDGFELVHPVYELDEAVAEAARCLYCDEICNICFSVCPNFANTYYETLPRKFNCPILSIDKEKVKVVAYSQFVTNQKYQIINIADFCNECGNCDTFCPTSGAPYKTKPRFALSKDCFEADDNIYFWNNSVLHLKKNGVVRKLLFNGTIFIYSDDQIELTFNEEFIICGMESLTNEKIEIDTSETAEMLFYYINLKNNHLFNAN